MSDEANFTNIPSLWSGGYGDLSEAELFEHYFQEATREQGPVLTDADIEELCARHQLDLTSDILHNPFHPHDTSINESIEMKALSGATSCGPLQERLFAVLPKLKSVRKHIAQLQAMEHELQAQLVDAVIEQDAEQPVTEMVDGNWRLMRSVLATSFNQSERTVEASADESHQLVNRYPATLLELERGHITNTHASRTVSAGVIIRDQDRREAFEQRILEVAAKEPPARFTRVAKRVAEEYAAETIDERHARARKNRGVEVKMLDDGLASLTAILDAVKAFAIKDRIDQFAIQVQAQNLEDAKTNAQGQGHVPATETASTGTGTAKSLSEIRADVFEDVMLSGDPVNLPSNAAGNGIEGIVRVTIPALTLIRECDLDIRATGSAELQGHGPIDTETARRLVSGSKVWERVLTDPVTGLVLAVDKYVPTEAMRRHLNVRDEHCRFPGCRRSAEQTDKDHTIDWQYGGKTEITNLASLCRGHHSLKHAKFAAGTRWRVTQKSNGDLEWISPIGSKHIDRPRSTVAFKPSTEILEVVASARSSAPPPF